MRPVILAFVAFYLPGFRAGGPIRTISNMVDRLGEEFDFRIVTMDRDLHDRQPYKDVHVDKWNDVGNARVFYASEAVRSFSGFVKIMRDTPHDLLYFNSFFDPYFTFRPLLARQLGLTAKRPIILAPRGELSAGALSIKSWKKKPFIQLARISRLFKYVCWQASTVIEASDIRQSLLGTAKQEHISFNIAVASDLLPEVEHFTDSQVVTRVLADRAFRVCFLSRITPMKNLEYVIKVLSNLNVNLPIELAIYGPKEDLEYWDKCQALINGLPANVTCVYYGSVNHAEVKDIIRMHDIFFVPSLGENFGHVFIESLSVGVPILVSDNTPWRGLKEKGIGWDISLNQLEKFVEAIEEAVHLSVERRGQIRLNCINFARAKVNDGSALEQNRNLFLNALTHNNLSKYVEP